MNKPRRPAHYPAYFTMCSICGMNTNKFPDWDKSRWACRPCWNGYVNFRRAYKKEYGRYPAIDKFRED